MKTIREVAAMANVSVATVSRVLNDSGIVSYKARAAVLRAIRETDYSPNLLGRSLRRTETRIVLVLLPTIANPFYSGVVKGMEEIASEYGYNVMMCDTASDPEKEKLYTDLLRNRLADGIIFLSPEMKSNELSELAGQLPVVQCSEYKEEAGISTVAIDNSKAAYTAICHLINMGHKRISMISVKNDLISARKREEGYRAALMDHGIRYDAGLIEYGDYSFKSGIRAGNTIIYMKERPTAVFAISDIMAIGAIKAVREAGLQVPNDIAVMGFDNISFSSMCSPTLSTISQPRYDIGSIAMKLLVKQLENGLAARETIFLEHELIIRESTMRSVKQQG